jgi:hypothetical protein
MRRWLAQPVPWGIYVFTILLLGAAFGVGAAFAIQSAIDSHDAKTAAARQAEGRRVAVDVLCGGVSGVEDAGKQALNGTLDGLHGRGVPREAVRDYVSTISNAVILQAGVDARKVLKADGQIDCDKLRIAARASHP